MGRIQRNPSRSTSNYTKQQPFSAFNLERPKQPNSLKPPSSLRPFSAKNRSKDCHLPFTTGSVRTLRDSTHTTRPLVVTATSSESSLASHQSRLFFHTAATDSGLSGVGTQLVAQPARRISPSKLTAEQTMAPRHRLITETLELFNLSAPPAPF
jgi:hypothetical protein